MALTLRLIKGDTLTFEEMDGNFTDLSSSVSESFQRIHDTRRYFLDDPSVIDSLINAKVFRVDVGRTEITGSTALVLSGSGAKFSIISASQEKLTFDGETLQVAADTLIEGSLTVRDPGDTDNVVMSVGGAEQFTIANGTVGTFFSAESTGNITANYNLIVSGVLVLNEQNPAPTPIAGGIIFTGSNFFLGI